MLINGRRFITPEYEAQQRQLHEARDDYGTASVKFAPAVSQIVNAARITTLLDYGAGKGRLARALEVAGDLEITMFDPAVPAFSAPPEPAELVCCIDVLEHVEPQFIEGVISHIASLTKKFAFITVHCGPAVKTLPDGRNAHLTQQPPKWWLGKMLGDFDPLEFRIVPGGCMMVLKPVQGVVVCP